MSSEKSEIHSDTNLKTDENIIDRNLEPQNYHEIPTTSNDYNQSLSLTPPYRLSYENMNVSIENAIIDCIQNDSISTNNSSNINLIQEATLNVHNDEFVSRLIKAVQQQPCLYNPNHEHYGNKHASGQFRANVWKNLCKEINFNGKN